MASQASTKRDKRSALLALRRRSVPTSLGLDISIRPLDPGAFVLISRSVVALRSLGAIAALPEPGDVERASVANKVFSSLVDSPKGQEFFELMERVIRSGCTAPKFGTDPAAGPVVSDLPFVDQVTVFTAIVKLSAYPREGAVAVRPS